jgi:ribosomal-protein-alanine N-acetyltransferase
MKMGERAREAQGSGDSAVKVPEFRPMLLSDVPAITAIEREAFTVPWSAEAFVNEIRHNHFARYTVMELDQSIIGYGGMWVIMDEAHVTNIAVRAQYRGRGYGEMLLRRLMQTAREQGARSMTLEVRVSNEVAQNLYRKLGFKQNGIRPRYYTDNQEDAYIMWADLASGGGTT